MTRLTRVAAGLAAVLLMGTTASATGAMQAQALSGPQTLQLQTISVDDRGGGHGGMRDSSIADGGLPEPARWVLMMIGVAMIGGALRGFVVTNRNLARLQPDDPE